MYTDNFFHYIKLADQPKPGIFRFWFNYDRNIPDNSYILSVDGQSQSYYSDFREPVIILSLKNLSLLLALANVFSDIGNCFRPDSDGEIVLCKKSQNIEVLLHDYFEVLMSIFDGAVTSQHASPSLFRGYCRVLEELLFLNTIRQEYKNQYLLSPAHPMVLMQHYVEILTKEEIDHYLRNEADDENRQSSTNKTKALILESLYDAQNKNRRRFQLMRQNQVYVALPENPDVSSQSTLYNAVPFGNRKNNTEIPAIRLYEKIETYITAHRDNFDLLSEIKIAYFGQLTDIETLQSLCMESRLCPKLTLTCFEQDRGAGEYIFRAAKKTLPNNNKETYDLLHNSDLESLFSAYNIVLFLDLDCFYRQFQGAKTIEEKSTQRNCQWYWERTEESFQMKFKTKAAYYRAIYDYIGMWLNSYQKELSSRFEFDERLFHAIDTAYKSEADIYLYLDYSDEIAEMNLRNYNVCNDEYYDGKELIVYKFTAENAADSEQYYKPFSALQIENAQPQVSINLWKIVKSISNSFGQMLIDSLQQNHINLSIIELMNTVCVLKCSEIIDGSEAVISYSIQSRNTTVSACKEILNEVVQITLEQAFGRKSLACMRRFFRNLIVHYIVSNSESIRDLLFAHLLSVNQIFKITLVPENLSALNENLCETSVKKNIDFKARNTVYSLIDRLADLKLRTIENRTDYFIDGFRLGYCPDMSESMFRSIMASINHCCEEWGYTDSRLYVNSKIE